MKKVWKWTKRTLLFLISIPVVYLLVALLLSVLTTKRTAPSCKNEKVFYIGTNGVHLDIIFPVSHAGSQLTSGINIATNTEFIAIGWGDRDFYLNTPNWSDLSFRTAMNAMLLKSPTLMHVIPYNQARSDWISISVCQEDFKALENYVLKTFYDDGNGKVIVPNRSYGYGDSFYKAHGNYSCFNTCNTWANKGLKSIGLSTAVWTPFDFGVLWHLE